MVTTPSSVFGSQSVTLAWNPVTNANVAGYNIYYGSVSQTYTNVTPVGNVTNATISGFVAGATYYFAATTLSTSGQESAYSSEVSYTVPNATPVLQVTPGSIGYGTLLVGTSKTNSFTVQNIGTGTLSGTASVSAPFSVVSGGSYSLGANAEPDGGGGVQSGGGEQLQSECELYGREWDEHDGERERDQCAGAHADPPGDAGEHRVWDVAGGDEQDEQFYGAEHRDGDIERDGECERALQRGVGRQLQFGRRRRARRWWCRSVRRWRATTIRV